MYSRRVGTRAPANRLSNQLPASSRAISAAVKSLTRQGPRSGKTRLTSVVRVSVSSWITTRTPSLVRWTSFSTQSKPRAIARSIDSRVFSGAYAEAPRWA